MTTKGKGQTKAAGNGTAPRSGGTAAGFYAFVFENPSQEAVEALTKAAIAGGHMTPATSAKSDKGGVGVQLNVRDVQAKSGVVHVNASAWYKGSRNNAAFDAIREKVRSQRVGSAPAAPKGDTDTAAVLKALGL